MKFRPKLQDKTNAIGDCVTSPRNITKQLCVFVAVYELLTALLAFELLPEMEILCIRHNIHLNCLKSVNCLMSLSRYHLDKAGTLLFHNSAMQR